MLEQRSPQGKRSRGRGAAEGEIIRRKGACATSVIEDVFQMFNLREENCKIRKGNAKQAISKKKKT